MGLQLVHRQRVPARREAMFQFQSCCGYFNLRTGSILIGIMSVACALAGLAAAEALAELVQWRSWPDGQRWAQSARVLQIDEEFVAANLRDSFSQHRFASHTSIYVLLHMFGIVEAFHCNFSLLLLYGIHKARPSLAVLWVRASLAAMCARMLLVVPLAAQALAAGLLVLGASALFLTILAIAPVVYFALVVHNYHSVMLSEKFLKSYARDWAVMR